MDGKIADWKSVSLGERPFPIDMAGSAFTFEALKRTGARFAESSQVGFLDTDFLMSLTGIEISGKPTGHLVNSQVQSKMVGLASGCSRVLTWHTASLKARVVAERRLMRFEFPKLEYRK